MRKFNLSNLTKGLILLLAILGIGAGLVVWKNKVGGHGAETPSFNSMSREEIELLVSDLAKTNPAGVKRLADDEALRKEQLENLKKLLAFASQAQKDGLADDETNRLELQNIRSEIIAVNYDREINKDKGPMPPFGFITEDQVNAYYSGAAAANKGFFSSLGDKLGVGHVDPEVAFQKFLDTKIKIMKDNNPQMKDREISDEERQQARDFFAKVQIYNQEFADKASSGELPKEFIDKVNLQVKLQQAQYLARLYSEKAAEKVKVTDEEIAKYIDEHPELRDPAKKAKAEEILARAKGGEDFAALANEFSEDPGNKGADGGQGGLYKDVTKGKMVPVFEEAALSLEPGQISPNLVESDFGYHIIKLERKGEGKGPDGNPAETYDVRHILISTTYKDPANPMSQPMPVKAFVRNLLEEQKEKKMLDDIIASNHIQVPDDYTVPQITDEQIQESMKKNQSVMGPDGGMEVDEHGHPAEPKKPEAGTKSEAKKPEAKKAEPIKK